MRLLNTLYVVEDGARVTTTKGALVVHRRDDTWVRVPMESLEGVVLVGYAQMTVDALAECVARRIRVAALRRSGRVRFVVGAPVSGNVHLRLAQYHAAEVPDRSLDIARAAVAGKLQNCRRLLQQWAADGSDLEREVARTSIEAIERGIGMLPTAPDGDTLRGIEGDGTRRYFKGLAAHLANGDEELRFSGRTRRPPTDPVNALLGFVYGMLLAEVVGALDSVGLDPQVGFLHGVRPGRPSLALDLLEELRPAVADRFVARVIRLRQVTPVHFQRTAGGACYLTSEGRRVVIDLYERARSEAVLHVLLGREVPRALVPLVQARLLARHLRGDLEHYPPFVLAR